MQWFASRRLQLTADNTKVISFGSKASLVSLVVIEASDSSLPVDSETVQPVLVNRDLK